MSELNTQLETVIYDKQGPLAWLTLNRPRKLNAIDSQMIRDLNSALDMAEADDEIRVILLKGAGKAFSAGADLGTDDGIADAESVAESTRRELVDLFDITMRFWDSPKPTVALVHRWCLGSALEVAIACDITFAAASTNLGAPEVKFGSGIVALLHPWICGPKHSKELLLTGNDRMSAEQAQQIGLVNQVVPEQELENRARELALEIARNDRLAVRLTKQAINNSLDQAGMREALLAALELDVTIETTSTDESQGFNDIMKEQGIAAAFAWRDRKFT
jgi:enoyl-CoA hydratase